MVFESTGEKCIVFPCAVSFTITLQFVKCMGQQQTGLREEGCGFFLLPLIPLTLAQMKDSQTVRKEFYLNRVQVV